MKKEKIKTIIIVALIVMLIAILNTSYTYKQEVNGQTYETSQKIFYYIIGLD